MKTYNFNIDNNKNTTFTINPSNKPNYSKILDDLIHADIMDKNYYLNDSYTTTGDKYFDKMIGLNNDNIFITSIGLKDANAFTKALNFLANYKKIKTLPYEYGKTYTLSDGTPIIFFDDSIQIGFNLYTFKDFSNIKFLSTLTPKIKKYIINIYINGLK